MPSISLTSLISYWSLDEASGTRNDSHGTNHLTDPTSTGSATGKVGTAADFENLSVNELQNASIDVVGGFTVSLWIKPESFNANYKGLFTRDDYPSTPRHQTSIYLNTFDKIGCYVAVGDGLDGTSAPYFDSPTVGTSLSTATWYHVVCTYDSTNGLIGYLNGSVDNTGATSGALQSGAAKVRLGKDILGESIGGADRYYDGLIDEVALWERAITSSEVTWLYNSGNGRSYADIYTEATGGAPKRYLLVRQ